MFKFTPTILGILLLAIAIACSSSTTGSEPDPDSGPDETDGEDQTEITTGILEITTETEGNVNQDGYTVIIGDESYPIDNNDSIIIEDMEEEVYEVELAGVNSNCNVVGENPVTAKVSAEETTDVDFKVACSNPASFGEGIIVFSRTDDSAENQLYTVNGDGSDVQPVGDGITGTSPVISPDGSQIAYVVNDEESGTSSIWVVSIDGKNPRQLTTPPDNFPDNHPEWSPDGQQLAYEISTEINGRTKSIAIIDVEGDTTPDTLTTIDTDDIHPSWSPDGSTILFRSDRIEEYTYDVFSINVDANEEGGELFVELNEEYGNVIQDISWSPDGTKIAYIGSSSTGWSRLYTMDADGSNPEYFVDLSIDLHKKQPTWSPDGEYIAFVDEPIYGDDHYDAIWTIKTDGTNLQRITDEMEYSSLNPSWGPAVK